MPASKHRAEVLVGLFVLSGVVLLGWLIFQFGQYRGTGGKGYPITVEVKDATGLRTGVPVRLGGVDIGRVVADPTLGADFSSLEIELRIFDGVRIPADSTVKVGTSGLMGDSYVRIVPPESPQGEYLPEGHRILAETSGSINDLAGSAEIALVEMIEAADGIQAAADRMESLFSRLEERILTEENIANFGTLLSELSAASVNVHAASKKLEPLLEETDETLGEVREAAQLAKDTFGGFTETLSAIHPVLEEFDETLDSLRRTLNSTNQLIATIEKGDGLASALLKDSELKRDLESFVEKLNRNGILFYPREGGILRNSGETPLIGPTIPSAADSPAEKRLFPSTKGRP